MSKSIKKKDYDYKSKYSSKTTYKPDSYYYCGEAFLNACGVPGPLRGSINMLLGHSNTAKTTALILSAVDAQRKGDLPVFIITERKWKWERAIQLGFHAEQNEDGEWIGDFIYNDDFDYIEQATDFVNEILNDQEKGLIDRNIVFLWDSIGSIPCKMTFEGKGGKQHNAAALSDKIGMGIAGRITKTRKEEWPTKENPLVSTLIVVNQPWVDIPDNPFGQPEIKPKGGNALYLACSYVFLFGNQKKAGINLLEATKNNRKITFATRTKISVLKDHDTGISYKDGKIIAVHNGFIDDTKVALEEYKEKYSTMWKEKLGNDFEFTETTVDTIFDTTDDDS